MFANILLAGEATKAPATKDLHDPGASDVDQNSRATDDPPRSRGVDATRFRRYTRRESREENHRQEGFLGRRRPGGGLGHDRILLVGHFFACVFTASRSTHSELSLGANASRAESMAARDDSGASTSASDEPDVSPATHRMPVRLDGSSRGRCRSSASRRAHRIPIIYLLARTARG